jgi:hypothetical protein
LNSSCGLAAVSQCATCTLAAAECMHGCRRHAPLHARLRPNMVP